MTNKYLEKIAGIAGRTIQAVKGADNVFKASTLMRDAVGFMKANKKPLAIGAGLGLAGGMAAGSAMSGQEKSAESLGQNVHDTALGTLGTAGGAMAGLNLGERLARSKVPLPANAFLANMEKTRKAGKVGAILGAAATGGLYAGAIMKKRQMEKKANHKGNKMTNKYLEKIAADYIAKGLVSPAWQEQSIAKEHGKKGPSAGELLSKHVGGTTRAGLRGYAEGAAGGVGGLVAGSAANALASKVLGKSVAGGGRIGAALGGLAGLVHGNYASLKNQAAEAHKKYKEKQAAENWIQGAIKHPGALHKALGVPADEKIPAAKLHAAAKKGGKIGREARLAETLRGLKHDKK